MSDLISRQRVIKEIDRFIPVDPMMSDYTQGISVGLAIATRCIEEFSQENHDSSQELVKDLISRQAAIDAVNAYFGLSAVSRTIQNMTSIQEILENLPSAEPETPSNGSITSMNTEKMHVRTTDGLIRRQDVLHELDGCDYELKDWQRWKLKTMVRDIPSAEPEIIRCRDCKYSQMTDDDECRYCKIWFAEEEHFLPGDYYCADAERR